MSPLQHLELRLLELNCRLSFRSTIEHAARIGDVLLEARELVEHGQWIPWVRRIGLSQRAAHDYMAVALHLANQRVPAGITSIQTFLEFVRAARRQDGQVSPTTPDTDAPVEWREFTDDAVDTDMSPFGNNGEPARQTWRTPRPLFDQLHHIFRFDVDAAADHSNALLPRYWSPDDDALVKDWSGLRVFCNPPFAMIRSFIEMGASASLAVFLVPTNSFNTAYFGEHPPRVVCTPPYRVLFVPPDDLEVPINRPSLGTSILVYGSTTPAQLRALRDIGPTFRS